MYLYDGEDIVGELGKDGIIQKETVHGPGIDEPLWMVTKQGRRYYLNDHLGSVTTLTDAEGATTDEYTYRAFGNFEHETTKSDRADVKNDYGFTGRTFNEFTGLMNYRSRFYSPSLGIFTQYDRYPEAVMRGISGGTGSVMPNLPLAGCPSCGLNSTVGMAGGGSSAALYSPDVFAHFRYVNNSPLNGIDPNGTIAPILAGAGLGFAISASINFSFNGYRNLYYYATDQKHKMISVEDNLRESGIAGFAGIFSGGYGAFAIQATGKVTLGIAMKSGGIYGAIFGYGAPKEGTVTERSINAAESAFFCALLSGASHKLLSPLLSKSASCPSWTAAKAGSIVPINMEVDGIIASRVRVGWSNKVAVVGRTMDTRVVPFAKGIGAETWNGFNPALSSEQNLMNNQKWVQKLIDEGYTVFDVGLDPHYTNLGNFTKGEFYGMESKFLFGD